MVLFACACCRTRPGKAPSKDGANDTVVATSTTVAPRPAAAVEPSCEKRNRGDNVLQGIDSELATLVGSRTDTESRNESIAVDLAKTIQERLDKLQPDQKAMVLEPQVTQCSDVLLLISEEFSSRGFVTRMAKISPLLQSLDKFMNGFNTICQAGPWMLQVLWGSVQLVYKISVRLGDVVDRISSCFEELFNSLPRVGEYIDLFPTDRLRRALATIVAVCTDFCLTLVEFLSQGFAYNFVRLAWRPLEVEFQRIQKNIEKSNREFDLEVQLAYMKAMAEWQRKMENKDSIKDSVSSAESSKPNSISSIRQLRRPNFTDRTHILKELEEILVPENRNPADGQQSCVLHGLGGVGKTEVAVEFVHRTQKQWDYVFWLRAETEVELTNDIIELGRHVNVYKEGQTLQENLEHARKWLNTTDQNWLLIFDNATDNTFMLRYWPHNEHGAILVTSQIAQSGFVAKHAIQVEPMGPTEGSELILKFSGNTTADEDDARALAEELGGLPLALAHYAGYIRRSNMSLREFRETFRDRFDSEPIWNSDTSAFLGSYGKTLQTVWDFALKQLTSEELELLQTLAFLHPDSVPEMMLIDQPDDESENARFKELVKLRSLITHLLDRHLVERDGSVSDASLRIHRILKRSILLRLAEDPKERQRIFDNAVARVRKVFPARSLITRIGSDLLKRYETFLPQVMTLKDEFERADPPLFGSLTFANLLCDAAYYLWDQFFAERSLSVSVLAEKICREQLGETVDTDPVLTQILSFIGTYYYLQGERVRAYPLMRSVVDRREAYTATFPEGQVPLTVNIDLARAWNDLACWHVDDENFEQAGELTARALEKIRSLGDEDVLKYRYAMQYTVRSQVCCGERKLPEALDYAKRALALVQAQMGERHYWTSVFQLQVAVVSLICRKFANARDIFLDIYEVRHALRGDNDAETLEAMYWVGTTYFYLEELDEAEKYLRRAIHLRPGSNWGDLNLARAQLRLALLLIKTDRPEDSELVRKEALAGVSQRIQPKDGSTVEEDLAAVEWFIPVFQKGRSTGAYMIAKPDA